MKLFAAEESVALMAVVVDAVRPKARSEIRKSCLVRISARRFLQISISMRSKHPSTSSRADYIFNGFPWKTPEEPA